MSLSKSNNRDISGKYNILKVSPLTRMLSGLRCLEMTKKSFSHDIKLKNIILYSMKKDKHRLVKICT